MFIVLQVAVALVLGFFLPGYLLAGILGAAHRWAWSIPISLVVLFWAVFVAGTCGLPVTAPVVAGILLIAVVAIGAASLRIASPVNRRDAPAHARLSALERSILCGLGAIVVVVLARMSLWPLSGYDIPFRWDFLARRILTLHNFNFYPPVTAADYRIYFYTDGIPPLVSFSYWWLYAMSGGWHPALTNILVGAQLALILWFTYSIGQKAHSRLAGMYSAGILGGSTLFVHSVAIGQETGLTALSIAAMFDAIMHRRDRRSMILAGIAAALGALSREYGCAIAILGFITVLWLGGGLQNALILCGTAAVIAGPWYVRNWLHAGNPFYSNRFGPFHVNAMHVAMMDYYRSQFGIATWDRRGWIEVGWSLLQQAPLQCTVGVVAAAIFIRKTGYLSLAAIVFVALWLDSIGFTTGNWPYAMRVLTPALVCLSVPAGMMMASGRLRPMWSVLLAGAMLWSIAGASVHPFDPLEPGLLRHWTDVVRTPTRPVSRWWNDLPKLLNPGSRVLCVNAYIQAGLADSGIEFVPVWSPEVAFVQDPAIPPLTARRRMLSLGIRYAVVENDPNGRYLANDVPFFHRDMPAWKVIGTAGSSGAVYELPAPND